MAMDPAGLMGQAVVWITQTMYKSDWRCQTELNPTSKK